MLGTPLRRLCASGSYRGSLNLSAGDLTGEGIGLVGILDAILVPGEHGAQLRADGLDALVGVLLLQLLEVRGAGILIVDDSLILRLAIFTSALVIFKHLPALARVLNRTEPRLDFSNDITYKLDE